MAQLRIWHCFYTAWLIAVVVTTHTLHVVCVLLVCGPSPYTGYQVDFLCLMGKVRLVLMLILLDLSFYTANVFLLLGCCYMT
jgi:hypothetical protein